MQLLEVNKLHTIAALQYKFWFVWQKSWSRRRRWPLLRLLWLSHTCTSQSITNSNSHSHSRSQSSSIVKVLWVCEGRQCSPSVSICLMCTPIEFQLRGQGNILSEFFEPVCLILHKLFGGWLSPYRLLLKGSAAKPGSRYWDSKIKLRRNNL